LSILGLTQKNPVSLKNRGDLREILTQKPGFWPRVRKSCI